MKLLTLSEIKNSYLPENQVQLIGWGVMAVFLLCLLGVFVVGLKTLFMLIRNAFWLITLPFRLIWWAFGLPFWLFRKTTPTIVEDNEEEIIIKKSSSERRNQVSKK